MSTNIVRAPAGTHSSREPSDRTPASPARQAEPLPVQESANPETVAKLELAMRVAVVQAIHSNFKSQPNRLEIKLAIESVAKLFQSPVRRGRRRDPSVTRAVELRLQNMPWPQVYRSIIANFDELDDGPRMLATLKLRQAVGMRMKTVNSVDNSPSNFLA